MVSVDRASYAAEDRSVVIVGSVSVAPAAPRAVLDDVKSYLVMTALRPTDAMATTPAMTPAKSFPLISSPFVFPLPAPTTARCSLARRASRRAQRFPDRALAPPAGAATSRPPA